MLFLSWPVCLLAKPCDMEVTTRESRYVGKKGRGFRIKGLDPLLLWIPGPSMGQLVIVVLKIPLFSLLHQLLTWILMIHSSSLETCGVQVASRLQISLILFQPLGRRHSKAAKEGGFHGHASFPITCIFIKATSFGGKNSEIGLQKLYKTMSDIHKQVVKRALLQASRRVVDPEKAR